MPRHDTVYTLAFATAPALSDEQREHIVITTNRLINSIPWVDAGSFNNPATLYLPTIDATPRADTLASNYDVDYDIEFACSHAMTPAMVRAIAEGVQATALKFTTDTGVLGGISHVSQVETSSRLRRDIPAVAKPRDKRKVYGQVLFKSVEYEGDDIRNIPKGIYEYGKDWSFIQGIEDSSIYVAWSPSNPGTRGAKHSFFGENALNEFLASGL